jgi:hypothetical protein
VIRLLLDPPRFECETATDAASLAKLMGVVVERLEAGRLVQTRSALSIVSPPDEDETGRTVSAASVPVNEKPVSVNAPRPRGRMKPTGKTKTCKTCGLSFPVVSRGDCASVYCVAHRPMPIPRKSPKPVTPAAGRLTRVPRVPSQAHTTGPESCTACGATVPQFELINGECLQCAPIAARKRSA